MPMALGMYELAPLWYAMFSDLGYEVVFTKQSDRKTNEKGQGPAWANSLFEDFCEFGMGMVLANKKMRARIQALLEEMIASDHASEAYKEAAKEWIAAQNDAEGSRAAAEKLVPFIHESAAKGCPVCKQLEELTHFLTKRSQWIIGGDGASYDIGYGTLNHALPVAIAMPRSVEPTPVEKPLTAPYVQVCESAPIVSMPGPTRPNSGRMTCSMPTRPCSK